MNHKSTGGRDIHRNMVKIAAFHDCVRRFAAIPDVIRYGPYDSAAQGETPRFRAPAAHLMHRGDTLDQVLGLGHLQDRPPEGQGSARIAMAVQPPHQRGDDTRRAWDVRASKNRPRGG